MSTSYPSSLDTFTTPSGALPLGATSPLHTTLHTNEGDAIEALQVKVGVTGSAVITSHDYRINALEAKDPGVFNVLEFGAAGDGVTDDTTSIQDAIDAAGVAGGGTVYLPKGTYLTGSLVLGTRVRLTGAGGNSTLLCKFGTSGSVVSIDSSATRVVLDHLAIDVNDVSGVDGVYFDNTGVAQDSLHRISNLWVYRAGRDGIHLGMAVIETNVENCFVYGSGRYGYYTAVGATDNRFISCSAGATLNDGFMITGNNTHYIGCKAFYSGFDGVNFSDGYSGFTLRPASSEDLRKITLTACEAQNNARNGYFLDGSASSATISYIAMDNCFADGNNMIADTGVGLAAYRVTKSMIRGFISRQQTPTGSVTFGLGLFDDMSDTIFDGCYIPGSSGAVYLDGSVTGNYKILNSPPYVSPNEVTVNVAMPQDHGLKAWTCDPEQASGSTLLTNGTQYFRAVYVRQTVTVTKLHFIVAAAAVTATAGQNHIGIYNSSGTKLQSVGIDSSITSTGAKSATITSQVLTPGVYWIGFLCNASTAVTLANAGGLSAAGNNMNLSTSTLRTFVNGTSKTALDSSITPGSNTSTGAIAFCGAVS